MRVIAALLVTSSLWAQSAQVPTKTGPQQGPPPKNLTVRPDGHVSANLDPENPDQFEVHVVVKGDTLSGIARDVLKNPSLWPQLWEQNEHIINPHWIYPNDKILIKPVVPISEAKPPEPEPEPEPVPEPVAQETPARPVQLPPPSPPMNLAPPQTLFIVDEQKPVSQIKYEDLYCSGSIRTADLREDLKIIAKLDKDGAILATDAEYVYLSQGAENGIAAGNMYQVVRPTRKISNPGGSPKDLGMHYLDVAQIRVVLTQPDYSLARVIHSCADAVDPGDILMPFVPLTFPDPPRPRPFNPLATTSGGVTGSIVTSKDVMLSFGSTFRVTGKIPGVRDSHLTPLNRGISGEGAIVYIDLGQEKGVKPGDVFIVYRHVRREASLYNLPSEAKKLDNTRTAIGELVVVKVGERASTAVVTYAADGLVFGDSIERR